MHHEFWHHRWREGRLGFHQRKINSRLRNHFHALALPAGATVFVPLCGKSLDMLWLAEQGYRVLGNEISDIACRDFYVENNLRYEVEGGRDEGRDDNDGDGGSDNSDGSDDDDGNDMANNGASNGNATSDGMTSGNATSNSTTNRDAKSRARFTKYIGDDIALWCGDFFALRASDLRDVQGVYDRAALIALPEAMRPDYAAHLATLLRRGAQVFLISMDYDERKMKGPPFSVPERAVRDLFATNFALQIITQSSGPDIVGHLSERGLDTLNEKVYLLRRL
ncbi:MAG: thiopurine S-methyltransferase [bacterium]